MSDYPMLISNKLHSFRNFFAQTYCFLMIYNSSFIKFLRKNCRIYNLNSGGVALKS